MFESNYSINMSELKPIKLFISYSHDDEPYFEVFNNGFAKVIKNARNFNWEIWDDTKIHIGEFWDDKIQNNVKDCDVAVLLVSVGFMASSYIREKEYNEFVNRYRDKGILIIPVIFSPCDFEAWGDLAKLQFFKPKGSEFGQSEMHNFTYADLIKFNERNGTLIPNPNIGRYHLQLVKKIEESYLNFCSETINKLPEKSATKQSVNLNILSDFPKPTALFTGRNIEKQQFTQIFKSFRIFAIDGLGGTGKTQFTAKCIDENFINKNNIIWLNGSAQSSFDVFVENSGYGSVLKGKEKTDLALFSGLKDFIEKDERIIFWDNFNDYEDIAFKNFLSFAHPYLRKSTIILITKIEPVVDGITTMPIIRLEGLNDDALKYGNKLKLSNSQYSTIKDSDIEKICLAVDGHPLAIEFSLSLMSRGKTVDDIVLHLPELSGIKKVEEFSKRLFLDIFNHSSTSDEERECFLKCSVFKENITETEIKYLNDGSDVYHLIDGLIDKLLITSRNGFFEIHPLVRSFSYEKLQNKKVIHNKAALYFIKLRNEFLSPSIEEKIFYHLSAAEEWELIADSIERDGKAFIQQGQLNFLSDIMIKLSNFDVLRDIFNVFNGDIAQIKSDWNIALEYFEQAANSNLDIIKAEGMIKSGEILYRQGNLKTSLALFENAYNFTKTQNLIREKARALNDIGLVLYDFSKFELANEKFDEALKFRIDINDTEGIANTYNNIGNIFLAQSKYSKALEFYKKSIEIAEKSSDKIALALYSMNIASVLRRQNKLHEALASNNYALTIYEEIGDKSGIAGYYNAIGSIDSAAKHFDGAFAKYNDALKVSIEINDRKNIGTALHNIGAVHCEKKNYEAALFNLYKSLNYYREIGNKNDEDSVVNWIKIAAKDLGKQEFIKLSKQILVPEKENNINFIEFLNEPYFRDIPKISRNEIIRVHYVITGKIVEAKFKIVEKDLNNGDCYLI